MLITTAYALSGFYEDRGPERGVIGRVRQGWPDHHNAAILATSIVRSSQT